MMEARLSKEAWIEFGLKTLLDQGYNALKAGSMAKELSVSRGSFYWHFQNMADFELQLMKAWEQRTTKSVIKRLQNGDHPKSRLLRLVDLALSNSLALDKAMRSWSMENSIAQAHVTSVDRQRIQYVESLMTEIFKERKIITPRQITLRANALYWATIGKSVIAIPGKDKMHKRDIDHLLNVFLS